MKRQRLLYLIILVLTLLPLVAHAQWTPDGVTITFVTMHQLRPGIIADGAGGAIMAWEDSRGGPDSDVYIQRVNSAGVPQWTANGVALSAVPQHQQDIAIVSDGAGGAIVFWIDYRNDATLGADIFARRINAAGTPQWISNGIPICAVPQAQNSIEAISDGAGGAIVTWRDARANDGYYDVYAQRVNAAGAVQWTPNGVAVATEFEDQTIPEITSDGAGGAVIAWFDRRSSPYADAYAQRLSSTGVPQWTDDGVAICALDSIQRNPNLVPDGSGGVFVSWWDSRAGSENFDIYAQRLNSAGVRQWTTTGVPVCTAPHDQQMPLTLNSGTGMLILWSDFRNGVDSDIFAQKLNGQGAYQWALNGVELCGAAGDQTSPSIAPDGSGGLIATWNDERAPNANDVYAQRITDGGVVSWTDDGVLLCSADGEQRFPVLASDNSGGAIVVWEDERTPGNSEIYAQRILSTGSLPFTTPVAGRTPSLRASDIYPNPVAGTAWLDVELASPVAVQVDVFDVAGRLVRADAGRRDGGARIAIDARDDAGRMLPSGVYFCRVQAAGGTITRKLVIAR